MGRKWLKKLTEDMSVVWRFSESIGGLRCPLFVPLGEGPGCISVCFGPTFGVSEPFLVQ